MFPAWRSSGARSTKNDFQNSLSAAGPGRPAAGDCTRCRRRARRTGGRRFGWLLGEDRPRRGRRDEERARGHRECGGSWLLGVVGSGAPDASGDPDAPGAGDAAGDWPANCCCSALRRWTRSSYWVLMSPMPNSVKYEGRRHVARLIGGGQRLGPLARDRHVDVGLKLPSWSVVHDGDGAVAQLDEDVQIGLEAEALEGHLLPARAGRWRDEDRRRLDGLCAARTRSSGSARRTHPAGCRPRPCRSRRRRPGCEK